MPFRPKGSRFYHYDFQIKGRRFHGSCGTDDLEEAKAVEAEARVKAKTDPAARGIFTISEALGTYITDVSAHQSSHRTTVSQGKGILSALDPKRRLDQLSNADLMHLVTRRRATVANGTVNRELDLLGRACRHMARIYGAAISADLDFSGIRLKEPKEITRELSWEEQARLFEHLRTDLHPFVKFALMTGARLETICELRWPDVDFRHKRILFRMKGDTEMFFPMNGELTALLSSLPRATHKDSADFVFTYLSHRTKPPRRQRIVTGGGGISEDFRDALKKAKIEKFRFHDLRHTFGTRMLRTTRNLKLVSRLMGHASIDTTVRYAHVLQDDMEEAVRNFSIEDKPGANIRFIASPKGRA